MQTIRPTLPAAQSEVPAAPLGRRALVVGAGGAGVAAVAAQALQRGALDVPRAGAAKPGPQGEGYRLTAHVLRYYETTKA